MKKFFVMIAVSLLGVSAMAQDATVNQNDEANVDQNYQQQMTEQDMQTFASPGEIIGGVIGGIIGGAIGGGRGDDGRGGWGPGHGPGPGRPHAWVCYATNLRRQTFQAQDWNQRRAQDQAIRNCYQYSRQCQPAGCRQY
jgi:hypothetical protein